MTTWHSVHLSQDIVARWNPKTRELYIVAERPDGSTVVTAFGPAMADKLARLIALPIKSQVRPVAQIEEGE